MTRYFTRLACLLLFNSSLVLGQAIKITSTTKAEVNIGIEKGTFSIKIENLSGSPMNNANIKIVLPTGINYVTGSIKETSQFQIHEYNITNLNAPVFQASNLTNGASYQFSIQYQGSCEAVTYQLAGNIFRNSITVTSSLGTVTHTSTAYNILYPSLSITAVSPKNQTIANKSSFTRCKLPRK